MRIPECLNFRSIFSLGEDVPWLNLSISAMKGWNRQLRELLFDFPLKLRHISLIVPSLFSNSFDSAPTPSQCVTFDSTSFRRDQFVFSDNFFI